MTYQLLLDTDRAILRLADGAIIPFDQGNIDYAAFREWLAAGNTPAPADPPPPPSQDELNAQAAREYAKLRALRDMTPAQVDAWVEANVTTLAAARDAIKTLAIAVAILARRL